jgi:hypothetical protein
MKLSRTSCAANRQNLNEAVNSGSKRGNEYLVAKSGTGSAQSDYFARSTKEPIARSTACGTTAIVSLRYVMEGGESAEIAVVGSEGIVGVPLFMGGDSASRRAQVQSAGGVYRLAAQLMWEQFDRADLVSPDQSAGPRGTGEAFLRMLCSGQKGIRPTAAD